MEAILRDGLTALGLPTEGIPSLIRFGEMLVEKNKVMNLTAITEPADVANLHFLDCAALLTLADFKGNIIFYSHDYETINTVANRIIEIKEDGIYDYSGTYEEYIEYKKTHC